MKKLLLTLGGIGLGGSLLAQTTEITRPNLLEIYNNGGWFSHFIALLLLCSLTFGIVRFIQLFFREKLDAKSLYLKLKGYLKNQNYDEAIRIAGNFQKATLGFMFWSGLRVFNDSLKSGVKGKKLHNDVQQAFDEAGMQKLPKIDGGLFWFDIIGQVATLAGLLGTIYGLMEAFKALGGAAPAEQQRLLTEGIQRAMGTTFMGLSVAIPTMFIKGFLQGRAEKIINDIDEYQVKMINQITSNIKE